MVQQGPPVGHITIIYLLSYYYDGPIYSHAGDSEFIMVRVRAADSNGGWALDQAVLSAHWNACCGADQTDVIEDDLFTYDGARPYVYVSEDHHANYESLSGCDVYVFEGDCSPIGAFNVEPVPYVANRNVGSANAPFVLDSQAPVGGCTYSKGFDPSRTALECFFEIVNGKADFSGWWPTEGTTHYRYVLQAFGFL